MHAEEITCFLSEEKLKEELNRVLPFVYGKAQYSTPPAQKKADELKGVECWLVFFYFDGILVVEGFCLDWKATWPISLIFSDRALSKYKFLFRHLFYCKYVESRLAHAWMLQNEAVFSKVTAILAPSAFLRQKMLHFIQNLEYYIAFEVIAPYFQTLQEKVKKVTKKTIELMKKIIINLT